MACEDYDINLKPCPFCGAGANGKELHDEDCIWEMVTCDVDYLKPLYELYPTEEDFARAWNTRAERTCYDLADGDEYAVENEDEFICSCCKSVIEINAQTRYCEVCGAKVVGR